MHLIGHKEQFSIYNSTPYTSTGFVFFGTMIEISFEIDCFYFFALMQKSNKKNQSAAADEI